MNVPTGVWGAKTRLRRTSEADWPGAVASIWSGLIYRRRLQRRLVDRLRVRYEHLDRNSGNIEFAGGPSFCTPQVRIAPARPKRRGRAVPERAFGGATCCLRCD